MKSPLHFDSWVKRSQLSSRSINRQRGIYELAYTSAPTHISVHDLFLLKLFSFTTTNGMPFLSLILTYTSFGYLRHGDEFGFNKGENSRKLFL